MLSCLLENAFQATAYVQGLEAPRVTVQAKRVGDTVRIDFVTERASAASEALIKAERFKPDVVLLDLQIPSDPGQANEDVEHGLSTLARLLDAEPFRPAPWSSSPPIAATGS